MSEASPSRAQVVADRLAHSQSQRPWLWLAISFAIGALALPWVLALDLNSDFQAMLPESAPSVRDLDEIRQRFGGTSTLTLAVQVEEGGSIEHAREHDQLHRNPEAKVHKAPGHRVAHHDGQGDECTCAWPSCNAHEVQEREGRESDPVDHAERVRDE